MRHQVFVSYEKTDRAVADRVCAALESRGIRCWVSHRDIRPGSVWPQAIADAIDECVAFVVVLSGAANGSRDVEREVCLAADCGRSMVVLRVEDVAPASALKYYFQTTQWLDAFDPSFEHYLNQLAEVVSESMVELAGYPTDRTETFRSGSLVGIKLSKRYRLDRLIGEGGTAQVFLAHDLNVDRDVAVKVLRGEVACSSGGLEAFNREAKILATLNHPNTVDVLDVGVIPPGLPYLVMDFVPGPTLAQEIGRAGAMPLLRACRILGQIAGAVEEAHTWGIVHLDLKPDNVKLERHRGHMDFVRVMDFGIAHAFSRFAGAACEADGDDPRWGTRPYVSPEQESGKPVDARADIYSLGVILLELLTGQNPEQTITTTKRRGPRKDMVPVLKLPGESEEAVRRVGRFLGRCLAQDPSGRFRNVAALLEELHELEACASPAAAEGTELSNGELEAEDRDRLPTAPMPTAPMPPEGSGVSGLLWRGDDRPVRVALQLVGPGAMLPGGPGSMVGAGDQHPLAVWTAGNSLLFGRGDLVDVDVDAATVSAIHAEIFVDSAGRIALRDLGSTNGTWVGRRPVTAGTGVPLRPGDKVRLGDVEFEVSECASGVHEASPDERDELHLLSGGRLIGPVRASRIVDLLFERRIAGEAHLVIATADPDVDGLRPARVLAPASGAPPDHNWPVQLRPDRPIETDHMHHVTVALGIEAKDPEREISFLSIGPGCYQRTRQRCGPGASYEVVRRCFDALRAAASRRAMADPETEHGKFLELCDAIRAVVPEVLRDEIEALISEPPYGDVNPDDRYVDLHLPGRSTHEGGAEEEGADLSWIPWETLPLGFWKTGRLRHLGHRAVVTRHLGFPPEPGGGPLRREALVMVDWADPDHAAQGAAIAGLMRRAGLQVNVVPDPSRPEERDLCLLRPRLVHVCGSVVPCPGKPEERAFRFRRDAGSTPEFFGHKRFVELCRFWQPDVFFLDCDSSAFSSLRFSPSPAGRSASGQGGTALSAVAAIGAKYLVATLWDVHPAVAHVLSAGFWNGLLGGLNCGQALRRAKLCGETAARLWGRPELSSSCCAYFGGGAYALVPAPGPAVERSVARAVRPTRKLS